MELDLRLALRTPGVEYPFTASQAIAPQRIAGDTVRFDDAQVEGQLMALEDGNVRVTGRLATTAHTRCANCLSPAAQPVTASFDELFLRDGDPMDDESFTYSGSRLSLERLAMTFAVLELPMRILCKPGCKGRPDRSAPLAAEESDRRSCHGELPTQRPFAALQQLLAEAGGDAGETDSAQSGEADRRDEEV